MTAAASASRPADQGGGPASTPIGHEARGPPPKARANPGRQEGRTPRDGTGTSYRTLRPGEGGRGGEEGRREDSSLDVQAVTGTARSSRQRQDQISWWSVVQQTGRRDPHPELIRRPRGQGRPGCRRCVVGSPEETGRQGRDRRAAGEAPLGRCRSWGSSTRRRVRRGDTPDGGNSMGASWPSLEVGGTARLRELGRDLLGSPPGLAALRLGEGAAQPAMRGQVR